MLVTFKDINVVIVNYIIHGLKIDSLSFINKTYNVAYYFLNYVMSTK